ncbi:MAG: hypothetical protein LKF53_02200 [Solobacterium sp.]|jgi:phi13 family phage major tail protein|nr:hypothetical protein [Solobacterium sp.]MCH4226783.1 hypothetical protein [Solobacterium sp.]MCH4281888.1 hypothetical protein [Solobacterium sp.]
MNKIKYGCKNAYYSVISKDDTTGAEKYATPIKLPGAKSISLSPTGDDTEEYADDNIWYSATSNTGYDGTVELMGLPDSFLTDVLGQTKDATSGALIEKSSDKHSEFALLFETSFEGDEKLTSKRALMYRCTIARPDEGGSTKEKAISAATDSLKIKCLPRESDCAVKASVVNTDTAFSTWFDKVFEVAKTTGE